MLSFFSPVRPLLKGWLLSLLGWGLVAFAMAAHGVTTRGDSWGEHLEPGLRVWLPWAIFSPLIFRLVARLPVERARWKIAAPIHIAACALVLFACESIKAPFFGMNRGPKGPGPNGDFGKPWERGGPPPDDRMGAPPAGVFSRDDRPGPPPDDSFRGPPPDWQDHGPGSRGDGPRGNGPRRGGGPGMHFDLVQFFSFNLPIYLMLLTGAHAALFFQRDQERAASLARARLESLRMQLQPHFLFNTLNTIAGLVHEQPDKADAMLTSLSDLLRQSLETSTKQLIPLHREIEFIENYLAIIHARFEERVRFELAIAPETREALVPPMLLQPIVENAVEHGLQPKTEGGTVRVSASKRGDLLVIEVADDGVGIASEESLEEGIGLSNTRARLREIHGERAQITLRGGAGFTVEIVLPFETEPSQ